jgi:hypothetical protein
MKIFKKLKYGAVIYNKLLHKNKNIIANKIKSQRVYFIDDVYNRKINIAQGNFRLAVTA